MAGVDTLSADFDAAYVKSILKKHADKTIADVMMDQQVFSGVGNIIRNEALYLSEIHPLSITGKIPAAAIGKLIKKTVSYSKLFYKQLETYGHLKTLNVYQQEYAADGSKVTMKILPRSKRKVFFSEHKQKLYS